MSIPFTFTHPDFSNVQSIGWYREALTFAIVVKFNDGATVTTSISGAGFQTLYNGAEAARIPWIELCPCCKERPGRLHLSGEGDFITICNDCAAVEEF